MKTKSIRILFLKTNYNSDDPLLPIATQGIDSQLETKSLGLDLERMFKRSRAKKGQKLTIPLLL